MLIGGASKFIDELVELLMSYEFYAQDRYVPPNVKEKRNYELFGINLNNIKSQLLELEKAATEIQAVVVEDITRRTDAQLQLCAEMKYSHNIF